MKTGQYSLHFASNESVRVYYYNQKTMVINAIDESESGILKSKYSSISIPLDFAAFQDCIEYRVNNVWPIRQEKDIKCCHHDV